MVTMFESGLGWESVEPTKGGILLFWCEIVVIQMNGKGVGGVVGYIYEIER